MKRRTQIILTVLGLLMVAALVYAQTPTPFATVTQPVGVAGKTGQLLVTENCSQNVDTIDSSGTVTVFAVIPSPTPAASCLEKYVAIVPPQSTPAGFTLGDVFVTQGADIYKIHSGVVTAFATIPPTAPADHTGITFDTVGTFDFKMIVTTSDPDNFVNGGKVYKVDGGGTVTLLADLSPDVQTIEGPAVAPASFGTYASQLLVADEADGAIYAINASGTPTNALTFFAAEAVIVIPTVHTPFFVAQENTDQIIKYPATDFTGLSGILVTSENGSGITNISWNGSSYDQISFDTGSVLEGAAFADFPSPTPTPTPTPTATATPTTTATATVVPEISYAQID